MHFLRLALLGLAPLLMGAQYYVNPSASADPVTGIAGGADAVGCGDVGDPCLTATRLLTEKALTGGDQVNLAAGTYYESVTITNADDGVSDGSRVVWQGAGRAQTKFVGLDSTTLNDAGCTPHATLSNVWQCTVPSTTILTVYETNWQKGRVIIDDRPLNSAAVGTFSGSGFPSTGQCNGSCTGHVFEPDYSVSYTPMSSGATGVSALRGSFSQSGTTLYVHPWLNDAPSASINIEVGVRARALYITTSTEDDIGYITFKDMSFQYGGAPSGADNSLVFLRNTIGLRFENITFASSISEVITAVSNDDLYMGNCVVASGLGRDEPAKSITTTPTTGNGNGQYWIDQATGVSMPGIGMNLKGPENGGINITSGALIENSVFQDAWGVLGTDGTWNSTFRNVMVKNSANHSFGPNGSNNGQCSNLLFDRMILLNGQEGVYHNSCANTTYNRVLGQISVNADLTGGLGSGEGRVYSSVLIPSPASNNGSPGSIQWESGAATLYSDYNWGPSDDIRCQWGSNGNLAWVPTTGAGNDWRDFCSHPTLGACDTHSIANASVTFANATVPYTRGLTAGNYVQSDFYPVAGSPLIDAGNPDIDRDGVVETTCSGGTANGTVCSSTALRLACIAGGGTCDDACVAINHCFGAAPDIGPYEFGIDTIAADSTAPSAITNLSVTSCTSGSCSLSWTTTGDDAGSGTAASYDIRYNTNPITEANWSASTTITGEPTPVAAGNTQTHTVSGLLPSTTYYFAMKVSDEVPNTSGVSNSPSEATSAGGGGIACTEGAFEAAIASANAGTLSSITFNCTNTTITLTASRYAQRILTGSNVTIDGESKGIMFEMSPPWWDLSLTFCAGTDCDPNGDNTPDACPDTGDDGRSERFLQVTGSNDTIKNLGWRYFHESTQLQGAGTIVDNITCDMPGDDCLSNPNGADVIIRNSTITRACDKAIQLYGNNAKGSGSYDSQIINTTIQNSVQPIRLDVSNGRHLVQSSIIEETATSSGIFTCDGPRYTGTSDVTFWQNNTMRGCRRGLRVGGTSEFVSLGGNTYINQDIRGISVYGTAKALIKGDNFTTNGGLATSTDPIPSVGGIGVGQTAYLDLGGGSNTFDGSVQSSTGSNTFTGNRSTTDSTQDVQNLTSPSVTVKAENNCWGDVDPSDQVSGDVDYTPISPLCGGGRTIGAGVRGTGVEIK